MNLFNTALVTLSLTIPAWAITYKLEIIYGTVGLFLFLCVNTYLWLMHNADKEDVRQKEAATTREDIHRYK